MTLALEFNDAFLSSESIELTALDLAYGFSRGWITAKTVIECACREIKMGVVDEQLLAPCCLLSDESDRVSEVLEKVRPASSAALEMSARKWLFLHLSAAYNLAPSLDDPFVLVDQIYSDFDYPSSMRRFVQYMPLQVGDSPGHEAIIQRWRAYLTQERLELRALSMPRREI